MEKEQGSKFTPRLEKEIEDLSDQIASMDQEALDSLKEERSRLLKVEFTTFQLARYNRDLIPIGISLRREVEIVDEVIKRAEKGLVEKGKDRVSQMRGIIIDEELKRLFGEDSI